VESMLITLLYLNNSCYAGIQTLTLWAEKPSPTWTNATWPERPEPGINFYNVKEGDTYTVAVTDGWLEAYNRYWITMGACPASIMDTLTGFAVTYYIHII